MKLKKIVQSIMIIIGLILVLITFTGCSTSEENLNEKAINEVEYLENKFVSILNRLNNITFENYRITADKVTLSQEMETKEQSSSSSQTQGEEKSEGENEKEESKSGSSTIIASQMSPNTILNPVTMDIDWAGLKNEIENLYYAWNSILLDLHQLNIDNTAILGFSNDLDKATNYIKNEDKANSLLAVANLYQYLPQYLEKIPADSARQNIAKAKSYILNAYALVETGDWNAVKGEIAKANNAFKPIITDTDFVSANAYRVNKTYILLNELTNSLGIEDKDVFYIKYRNLLEEITTL